MSGWNDFTASVNRLAQKASMKAEDLADSAALYLRLNEARNNLDEAYAGLGRLMYVRLRDGVDNTVEIDAVLSRIDTLIKEICRLETTLDAKKSAKQANRDASKSGEDEAETAGQADDADEPQQGDGSGSADAEH